MSSERQHSAQLFCELIVYLSGIPDRFEVQDADGKVEQVKTP
jgi:hypothetical protein